MGGNASKVGAVAGRGAKNVASKGNTSVKPGGAPPPSSFLPRDDDAVKNFKPSKVVDMSRSQARAAARGMYEETVPEMDPEVLRQFKAMPTAEKSDITDQRNIPGDDLAGVVTIGEDLSVMTSLKLVPDASEVSKVTKPRPLPQDRSRVVISKAEVAESTGMLTQTQVLELLAIRGEPTPDLEKSRSARFGISRKETAILLKYYRTPYIQDVNGEAVARWDWSQDESDKMSANR